MDRLIKGNKAICEPSLTCPMLVVIVAAGLVGGLIGGFIGQKALKKHFIKAGLVSVK